MKSYILKLKNNNKGGGDLQFATLTFLFIFIVCISLLIDFWYVSSAKINIIKEVQGAELFRLVTAVKDGGGLDDPIFHELDPNNVDLRAFQQVAVNGMRSELQERLDTVPYLKDYTIDIVSGLSQPIGEMGVHTEMRYHVKTMIRSPNQIFNFMKKPADPEITSAGEISLKVTTKLVPYIFNN